MQNTYSIKFDLAVLNPKIPPNHGPVSFVRAAFHEFVDGRWGWKIDPEQCDEWDDVLVTMTGPDDSMSIDDRRRWHDALRTYGLRVSAIAPCRLTS